MEKEKFSFFKFFWYNKIIYYLWKKIKQKKASFEDFVQYMNVLVYGSKL